MTTPTNHSQYSQSFSENGAVFSDEDAEYKHIPNQNKCELADEHDIVDRKLRATLEHIFEKYGQDFGATADVIDIETGEIVVDNGHLRHMQHEGDIGPARRKDPVDEDDNGGNDDNDMEGPFLGTEERVIRPENQARDITSHFFPSIPLTDPSLNLRSPTPESRPRQLNNTLHPFRKFQPCDGSEQFTFAPSAIPDHISPQAPKQPRSPTCHQETIPNVTSENGIVQRYDFPSQQGATSIWAPYSRQEDDDKPVSPPNRGPGRPPGARKKPCSSFSTDDHRSCYVPDATSSAVDFYEVRRSSGRVRKQVEHPGLVSWVDAGIENQFEEGTSCQASALDLQQKDTFEFREEFERASGCSSTWAPNSMKPARQHARPKGAISTDSRRNIRDSRDSTPLPASNMKQHFQPKAQPGHTGPSPITGGDWALALAHDEAPLFRGHQVPNVTVVHRPDEEPDSSAAPEQLQKRGRGRPRKLIGNVPGGLKRKPGRPKMDCSTPSLRLRAEVRWLQKILPSASYPGAARTLDLASMTQGETENPNHGSTRVLRSGRS